MHSLNDNPPLDAFIGCVEKTTPSPLVERAMGAAAHLIDQFANDLEFYRGAEMSVLEQWMLESYPEVVEQLRLHGMYADFAAKLEIYREELIHAAAAVATILEYGFDDVLEHHIDCHLVLSSLSSRIWSSDVKHLDRATTLVSFLLGKHTRSRRVPDYCTLVEAPAKHTKIVLQDELWGWCDISEARTASSNVAHLIIREHFPSNMAA